MDNQSIKMTTRQIYEFGQQRKYADTCQACGEKFGCYGDSDVQKITTIGFVSLRKFTYAFLCYDCHDKLVEVMKTMPLYDKKEGN